MNSTDWPPFPWHVNKCSHQLQQYQIYLKLTVTEVFDMDSIILIIWIKTEGYVEALKNGEKLRLCSKKDFQ